MKFEKLTKKTLIELQLQGYNLLKYNNNIKTLSKIWFPEYIENVYEHIANLCSQGLVLYDNPNILVIEDEIENISKKKLNGYVFICSY